MGIKEEERNPASSEELKQNQQLHSSRPLISIKKTIYISNVFSERETLPLREQCSTTV